MPPPHWDPPRRTNVNSNRKPEGKALVTWLLDVRGSREMPKNLNLKERGEFYISHDASQLISILSWRLKINIQHALITHIFQRVTWSPNYCRWGYPSALQSNETLFFFLFSSYQLMKQEVRLLDSLYLFRIKRRSSKSSTELAWSPAL